MAPLIQNEKGKIVHAWIPFTASTMTGILFAPLELGSTRSKSRQTTIRGFRLICQAYRNEGFLALWRGSGWFVAGNAASRTTWLVSYDYLKGQLLSQKKLNDPNANRLGNVELMAAGFGSGVITAIVTNPIWTLKSFAQLPNYPGILYPPGTSLAKIITNPSQYIKSPVVAENRLLTLHPRTLIAGTMPAIGYVATESMFQLFILEKLKEWTKNYTGGLSPLASGAVGGLLGGVSRVVILPVTFPLHVLTLRVREQYKPPSKARWLDPSRVLPQVAEVNGVRSISQNTVRQSLVQIAKGIHSDKAWYAGIGPYTARVVPQAAILFFMVEGIKAALERR